MFESLDGHCGSAFWNQSMVWETETPNFTECFQKTILIWIPFIYLLISLPFEIHSMKTHRKPRIALEALNVLKVVFSACLMVLALMEFFYWIHAKKWRNVASVNYSSTLIKICSLALATILIILHRLRGQRLSATIFLFWLLNTFSASINLRTFLLEEEPYTDLYLFVCCVMAYPILIVQLMLATICERSPKECSEGKMPCPMKNANLISLYLFSWFDKMCWLGFRRPLTKDDLWDLMSQYRCSYIFPQFQKNWQKLTEKSNKPPNTIIALIRTIWKPFLAVGCLTFLENLTNFSTPIALRYLINFVGGNEPTWRGYFYCVLLLLMGCASAFLYSQQCYWGYIRIGMRVNSALISAIYRKAIRINNNVKNTSTTGEIINLMSSDVGNLSYIFADLHYSWTGSLQLCLAFYMLWNELGPSALAGLATLLVLVPLSGFVSSRLQRYYKAGLKYKDERVKLMNEILSGIKVLKLYAWENSFESQVNGVRKKELEMLKKNAYLTAFVYFIFGNVETLAAFFTFTTYVLVDKSNDLNAEKIFVSLSLINIMNFPLMFIPMIIVDVVQALVSVKRLNKFFNHEELDPNATSHDPTSSSNAISIENGTFAWSSEGDPILKDIYVECPNGHLVAVLGSVGSGKSTLLSAILGETERLNGRVNTNGSIAYVPQQAWIQNATLQDNITFGTPLNKEFYNKVIEACALTPDLKLLPGGDQTEIGEKGINLSGGQKQRVSLARAVYSNADIVLLDDPLSAVDAHVGKHIFDKVIGPGGLLKQKTRIFITNGITYLKQVNTIVVLVDGQISEIGTYEQLLQNKGAFAEFLLNYLSQQEKDQFNENESKRLGVIGEEVRLARLASVESDSSVAKSPAHKIATSKRPVLTRMSSTVSESSPCLRRRFSRGLSQESQILPRSLSIEKSTSELPIPVQDILIEEETAETGNVSLKIYKKYFKALGIWLLSVTFSTYVLSTVCEVFSNIWLSLWSQDQPEAEAEMRTQRISVYGCLGVLQMILTLLGGLLMANGSVKASYKLHHALLTNVLRCPLSFFDTTPLGRILNRFSKDMGTVDDSLAPQIQPLLGTLLEIIAIIVVISMNTPLILSVIIPTMIIFYFVQRFYIATSRQLRRLESISHSPIFAHFSETLFGTSTIRAFGRTNDFILENERLVDENNKHVFLTTVSDRWLGLRLHLIGNFICFSAALFAVMAKDVINPGIMGLSVTYSSEIVILLIILVRNACELEANIVSVERISEYTTMATERPAIVVGRRSAEDWPEEGTVSFKNYSTRYRDGLDLVLTDLYCEINKQEKIGIVGRTGAGKSSLALALFRIIEPAQGTIFIDGTDITEMGLHDLRSRLTIIPQDPVLFSGTLRMNLDPFGKFSDDDVWQALEHSHLKSFVTSLTHGLNHEVSEGGENLSVGQRQLICLARALLRKSKVLVLDEATAAVDLETDDLIQSTIRKEFADCTVITIAHRINTIMDSTRIMVLDKGKIVEFDSPNNLLNNTKTIFYSLAKDAGIV